LRLLGRSWGKTRPVCRTDNQLVKSVGGDFVESLCQSAILNMDRALVSPPYPFSKEANKLK